MGREARRVPLDFNAPLGEVWEGYIRPESFDGTPCPDCEHGYSPFAKFLHDQWYGRAPFNPRDKGSEPWTVETPEVRRFAERNVVNSPEYYGTGEEVIVNEANRLLQLWNKMWLHHLSQEEVDILVKAERLTEYSHDRNEEKPFFTPKDPMPEITAEQVNMDSVFSFSNNGLGTLMDHYCKLMGVGTECSTCEGHATLEVYEGQREAAEAWEWAEPPVGEGYQMWSTTSEGSPESPVFKTAEELAEYCVDRVSIFGYNMGTYETWLGIIKQGDLAMIEVAPGIIIL